MNVRTLLKDPSSDDKKGSAVSYRAKFTIFNNMLQTSSQESLESNLDNKLSEGIKGYRVKNNITSGRTEGGILSAHVAIS